LRKITGNESKRCAVIGGGLLGLELADSLLKRGCHVIVIEGAERLLPRNLDKNGSIYLFDAIKNIGNFEVLLNRRVSEITSDSVILADGKVECDLVFLSAGAGAVYPKCPTLQVERAIVVDKNMKTNLPDIFAAGDCAQLDGFACGLFTEAAAMGKVAGVCAAGGETEYKRGVYPARFNALGIKLFSAGNLDESLNSSCEQKDASYKKVFYNSDGTVAGVILIGDISESSAFLKQLNN
jgi:nitrite reductase (NADH) large subunit